MKKNIWIGLMALFLGSFSIFAQSDRNLTAEDAISYINVKIKGIAQIRNNRGLMLIDFYNKGKVIRTDKVAFSELNADNVDYMPDEKAIVIKCTAKDCIERDITIPRTHGQFSRISISGDFDAKTQMGLIHAFEHLLLLFKDPSYKSNKPFER
jgi:hypothetical protein